MVSRILIIAGSDSGGGAGIQADIKTVTCLGGYATTAITALTAQNTLGVTAIHELPASFIKAQIDAILEDIGADAIKTGMLQNSEVIHAAADAIEAYDINTPLIVDPVIQAKGGVALLQPEAVAALKTRLIRRASLITPNIPEAELLSGQTISSVDSMKEAGHRLLELGSKAVLIKGGHLHGDTLSDVLVTEHTAHHFTSPRLNTPHTHGTGCTMASAIALGIAEGLGLYEAVLLAHNYVHQAILTAPGLGKGHGPLNHMCNERE